MKPIKLLAILFLLFFIPISCTSSETKLTSDGVIELCKEKSNGDIDEFRQCISKQFNAAGKVIIYLRRTNKIENYHECEKQYTDNQNRVDLVMVARCLGCLGEAI
jgi:hypothetical protein